MHKIKDFLNKKRCRNNKGFSLIEIMVALGLITLLTALAIPQFTSYKRSVRYGVLRSMLSIGFRAVELETSLGTDIGSLNEISVTSKIKSKDKGDFTKVYNSSGTTAWCYSMTGVAGKPYEGFNGCVNNSGSVVIGGTNVPCKEATAKRKAHATTPSTTCDDSDGCPSGCVIQSAFTATCSASDTAGELKQEIKCKPGTSETFSKNVTCNTSGQCVR